MTVSSGSYISTAQKRSLNRMNKASKDVQIGSMLSDLIVSASATSLATLNTNMVISGSHTVTAAEHSASAVLLLTGTTAIRGFFVQCFRSGSSLWDFSPKVVSTGSKITVSSGCSTTFVITENDVVQWQVF